MNDERKPHIRDMIGVKITKPDVDGIDDSAAIEIERVMRSEWHKVPWNENGEKALARALEASGQFVPGSVTVKISGDGAPNVTATLKGKIQNIVMKAEIKP